MILDINVELLVEVLKAKIDFVFLGGSGVEMMSREFYRTYIIPDSQKLVDKIHRRGCLIYNHICSLIELVFDNGIL